MGYKIKERRESLGMSKEELALKSGVSRVTIWALETNPEYTTTTKTLVKLATALNCTIDAIFFTNSVQSVKRDSMFN